MPRRVARRRVARKGRKVRRSRVPRSVGMFNDRGQLARIKETVEFTDLNPNLGYNFNFNLSQFRRASNLAPNFKFYKASLVEWTIEPLYNTFQDGTTGGEITIPYVYMTMNRTQDSTGIQLADIQAMGAKPKKLTTKMVIKYKPNWCSPGLGALIKNQQAQIVGSTNYGVKAQYSYLASPDTNPGLNTAQFQDPAVAPSAAFPNYPVMNQNNVNQVVYNGHTVWVDQEIPTGTLQAVARVTCTVNWEFKDPHCTYLEDTYVTVVPQTASV